MPREVGDRVTPALTRPHSAATEIIPAPVLAEEDGGIALLARAGGAVVEEEAAGAVAGSEAAEA